MLCNCQGHWGKHTTNNRRLFTLCASVIVFFCRPNLSTAFANLCISNESFRKVIVLLFEV